jgi:hypothetical protein
MYRTPRRDADDDAVTGGRTPSPGAVSSSGRTEAAEVRFADYGQPDEEDDDGSFRFGRLTVGASIPAGTPYRAGAPKARPQFTPRSSSKDVRNSDAPKKLSPAERAEANGGDLPPRHLGAEKRSRPSPNGNSPTVLLHDMALLSLTAVTVKKRLDFEENQQRAPSWAATQGTRRRVARAAAAAATTRDWVGRSQMEMAMLNHGMLMDADDVDDVLESGGRRKAHRSERN